MSKVTKSDWEALKGHPNMAEILEVLESETEPYEYNDWHNGYVIGYLSPNADPATLESGGNYLTHTLDHWKGTQDTDSTGAPRGTLFKLDSFKRHEEAHREARAQHGLEFLQRPHRKGPYVRLGPKTRSLVNEAYLKQHSEEWS